MLVYFVGPAWSEESLEMKEGGKESFKEGVMTEGKYRGASLLPLKMGEVGQSPEGMQMTSRSQKRQGHGFSSMASRSTDS